MISLAALALSFSCTGYGLIEVGIRGTIEDNQPKNSMVWLTDVLFPVDPTHIEKYEYRKGAGEERVLKIHIRDPEDPAEFFQLETQGDYGQVTFAYHGVRMTEQKVACNFNQKEQ